MTVQPSAQDLMRAAYENRYTWDPAFPGYTADVTFRLGDQQHTAKARVTPDLKAEVLDLENEEAKKAIHGQMWEVAIHRVRRTFEATHSQNTFAFGDTDETGAVQINLGGKSVGDYYRIRNNEVCLVHRHIHGTVVTINTFSSHDTGEGYLSHRYDAVYHDPQTGEQKGGKSLFEDQYEKVGQYFILTSRTIETESSEGPTKMEFAFANVKLLEPAIV